MIDGIGYTKDGEVWIRLRLEINGEQGTCTLMLKTEFARKVAASLLTSADKAAGYLTEKTDERNSPDPG